MKSKFTYICLASLLALNLACQDENLVSKENSNNKLTFTVSYASDSQSKAQTRSHVEFTDEDGKPTPFNISLSVEDTYAEAPITRGTPISTLGDFTSTVKEFKAWGYYDGADWKYIQGTKFKQFAGSDYRPVNESDQEIEAYNPTYTNKTKYRFYAIYPYETSEQTTRGAIVNCSNAGLTISYTSPTGTVGLDTNGGTDDAIGQKEVIAGYMNSTESMSVIPVTFQPILASIRFKVSKKQLGRNVTIKRIELHTLSKSGNCTVTKDGVAWSNLGTQNVTFGQDFNYEIDKENSRGNDINDGDLTKTFFIIPQKGSTDLTNGTRIIVKYTEKGSSEVHEARHLLYGQTFEAGKSYIFNIGDFEGSAAKMEPWVEFSKFQVNRSGLLGGNNEIHEENNSKFIFNFAQQTNYGEKAYFKIYNLEVGHWYSLDFTEKATLYNKDGNNNSTGVVVSGSPFNGSGQGCYACTVLYDEARVTDTAADNIDDGNGDQLIYKNFLDQKTFIWQHPDDIYNTNTYNPFFIDKDHYKTAHITFKATNKTMLWEWEFSSGRDGYVLRSEIYLVGDKIKDITPKADVPTVDFLNATLHNFNKNTNWDSYSSMKSYALDTWVGASDDEKGTLEMRVVNNGGTAANGGWGRVNIPLINLDREKTYRITYTLKKTGTESRTGDNYGLGYVIQDSKNESTGTFSPYTNYTSLRKTYTDAEYKFTKYFDFEATAENMFWVWDFSELPRSTTSQFITFSDVTIEEVAP